MYLISLSPYLSKCVRRIKIFICIALVLTFTFLCSFPHAQQALQLTYGGDGNDKAYDIVDAGNNQFYVIGNSNSSGSAGGYDIVVTKMQQDGTVLWSYLYGQGGDETVRKASKTSDGGLVLTGQTTSFNGHKGDILCMKLTKYGGVEWVTEYGDGTQYGDLGMDIIQTSDGGYAVSAILNVHGFVANAIVMKLNSQGTAVWYKTFDRGDGEDGVGIIEQGNTLIATSDIQHSVAGGNYTMVITKLDEATGNVIATKMLTPSQRGIFNPYIFKDNANGYWISGHMIDENGIQGATYNKMQQTIIKLDANFNVVKGYKLAVSPYTDNYFTGFVPLADGGFITCAATQTPSSSNVYRIDANGKVVFSKTISGGDGARQLNRLQLIGSNVVCVGSDAVSGTSDIFVTSFNIGGNTSTACGYDTALVAINNEPYIPSNFTWPTTTTAPIAGAVESLAVANSNYTPPNIINCVKQVTVTPNFTIPDTVCVNSPVNITNTSTGASSYYWNFCTADVNHDPTGTNLGNVGNVFNTPVFTDIVSDNGNYYAFVTSYYSGSIARLDFGNSMLNTPVATNLGSFGGVLPSASTEGVQVIKNEGKWYAIIVGGGPEAGTQPKIVKLSFGSSITNNKPVVTDWGNLNGYLNFPHDLQIFQDNGRWYGFTINKDGNTITRFDFTNSFENTPTATNLAVPPGSNLNLPTGFFVINDNNNWRMFIINSYDEGFTPPDDGTITRLDFGASLLNNNPTAVNIANSQLSNTMHNPRDISVIKFCGEAFGFVVNHATNDIVKLDFHGDLTSIPTATSLGNIGNLSFPHSISKLFRVGADIYSFIPNATTSALTRIKFAGCTNASLPYSQLQNPSPVAYATPGVYNINLTVDDGLSTQNSLCKQVVVIGGPKIAFTGQTTICNGDSAHLKASGGVSYSWLPSAGISNPNSASIAVKPTLTTKYFVTAKNSTGCVSKDSVVVNVSACTNANIGFTAPDTVCVNSPVSITNTTTGASSYFWSFCTADINQPPVADNLGNPGNVSGPVFTDFANQNGNYYGFVVNNYSGHLTRLEFGGSLLNNPTSYDLGNFGGTLEINTEGIQVVKSNGKWYAFIVGGDPDFGTHPQLVKIEFGTDLSNNTPTATDWGNIGNMYQPIDLYMFQDGAAWHGFTTNSKNNTITRFDFGVDFSTPPAGTNLGNIGNLFNYPTGIYAANDNGYWRVFITNGVGQTLTRLDFGKSLLNNTPTPVNLGNPGNLFGQPRDFTILKSCEGIIGFAVNGASNDLLKFNFNGDLTSIPTAVSLGNIGNFDFPHSLSKLFRIGSDIYSFITNVSNNTMTRLKFAGCNSASVPNSTKQNPPSVTYAAPGIYTINLTIDDSLPSQNSLCKQVVVLAGPNISLTNDTTICLGDSAYLKASGGSSYSWLPSAGITNPTASSIAVKPLATTKYFVTAKNAAGCAAQDSVTVKIGNCICQTNADFSFKQDVCSPASFQFNNETPQTASVSWDFGDGQKAGNVLSPPVTYNGYGTYKVTLTVQNAAGCIGSITKSIDVSFMHDSLITTNDTLLCKNISVQLNALPALSYCWSPSTGLSATDIANPVATVTKNTTYHLSSQTIGSNLIVNGDFSLGNTGFNSGYEYTAINTTEGQYYVGKNPNAWNGGTAACSDHTGNSGSMMLVNGNPAPDLKVWSETITVKPNTNYAFSAWLQPIFGVNPASLQFYINGKTIGNIFNAELPTCNWKQFFVTWNSGDTDKADISIINKNIEVLGNDFALDDISFAEVSIKYDSVNIQVDSVAVKVSPNTSICAGSSVQIQATVSPYSTFIWSPSVGLSSPADISPIASPSATTTYIINAVSKGGCSIADSVTVTVLQQPTVKTIADTAICSGVHIQLTTTVTNSNTFSWSPSAGLSDATQQNPVANPAGNTKYIITVNPGTQCSVKDSVNVTVNPLPALKVSTDTTLCSGASVQLLAISAANAVYSWLPSATLNDASSSNPTATPLNTTKYFVQVTGTNGCNNTDSITISVLPQPTVATIADTAICNGASVQLITNVVNGNAYNWSPAADLSNPGVQSPIASPASNTQYIIIVNPGSQCSVQDTVNIAVNPLPVVQAFGDTTLCAGAGSQLTAVSGNNVSYSWLPVAGLDNSLANNPVASPAATTTYTVQVTDVNKCTTNASVTVAVIPKPVFAVDPTSKQICVGDQLTLNASGGDTYQWYPPETVVSPTSASTQVNPLGNTTYNVIITNNTCKITDTVSSTITVNDKLATSVTKSNDVDCVIGSATLQATGGDQYTWTPAATLDHPAMASPIAIPLETTTYYVIIKKNGCTATDSVTVNVIVRNADNGYKMPSAFTPNGDNVNDCFGLKYWGGIKTLEFAVYNRWGNRVFYTNDPSKCWDGTFNGTPQPTGTFVYQIKAATICGNIYRKGTVVLIR